MSDIIYIPNFLIRFSENRYYLPGSDKIFINELLEAGKHVTVVAHCKYYKDAFSANSVEPSNKLSVVEIPHPEISNRYFNFLILYMRTFFTLAKLMMGKKTLTYIYYPGNTAIVAGLLAILFRVPFGLYVRGDWTYRRIYDVVSKHIFKRSRFVITTGKGFVEKIKEYNKYVEPVVPMLAPKFFSAPDKMNSNSRRAEILYVGRLVREKGIDDILNALALLKNTERDICLTVVGGGNESEVVQFMGLVKKNGLTSSVNYVGHVGDSKELERVYMNSDLFVFPSFYPEGFPRVVYEAMQNKLPVICTILPGMKQFMLPGKNCLEVSAESPSDISEAITSLLDNDLMRQSIANCGFNDVNAYLNGFSCNSHAEQVIEKLDIHSMTKKIAS